MDPQATALNPAVPQQLGAPPHILELFEPAVARTFRLGTGSFSCGRDPKADVVVNCPGASRNHARFEVRGGAARLVDLGSANGTYLNGQRMSGQEVLNDGDEVRIGSIVLKVRLKAQPATSGGATQVFKSAPLGVAKLTLPNAPPKMLPLFAGEQFIGRHADCDLVIPRADVSRRQAQVLVTEEELVVTDLDSSNGTFVDGRPIKGAARLPWGTVLHIGDNTLEFKALGQSRKSEEPIDRPTLIGNVAALRQLANDAGYGDDDERETQAGPKASVRTRSSTDSKRALPRPAVAASPRAPPAIEPAGEMTHFEVAPRSRWPLVVVALVLIAAGAVGAFVWFQKPAVTAQPAKGAAQVASTPPNAVLTIDARVTTLRTPARVELTPDTIHLIEARLPGYKAREVQVNVRPGEQTMIDLALEPDGSTPPVAPVAPVAEVKPGKTPDKAAPKANAAPAAPVAKTDLKKPPEAPVTETGATTGLLDVESTPPTDVYLGNRLLGRTPLKRAAVPPGELVLELRNKALGLHRQLKVKVKAGEHQGAEAFFRKGKVFFNITPWAELSIGDQELGRAPITVELYEGSYEVTASNADLGLEKVLPVTVEANKTVTVAQELK